MADAIPTDIIEDDGVRVFRSALEAVQFAGHGWEKTARSAAAWGYGGIQLSSFHLSPKELVETDLAERVNQFLAQLPGGDGEGPMGLAGYSTHCPMIAWGFPEHPGSLALSGLDEATMKKVAGKPEELRKHMWENVVQFIPEATKKLGLKGTHTFIPPAVVGGIKDLEYAGALVPSYNFVPTHGIPVLRNGEIVKVNLWEEALKAQAEKLKPFFDLLEKHEVYASHEMHFDTVARGIKEFKQALEIMGEQAKKLVYLGFDTSHAWQGESGLQWIVEGGRLIRNVHVKNKVTQAGLPLITGNPNWSDRGMQFGAADEGDLPIGYFLNCIVSHSDFVNQPTYRKEEPVGKIGGRDVYIKWAIGEGEHPTMSQVTVAKEYATTLNRLCQRRYGEGFKVGGTQG